MGGVGIIAVVVLLVIAGISRARQIRRIEIDVAVVAKLARMELKRYEN